MGQLSKGNCEGITWDKAGNKLAVKRLESVRESQRYAYDAAGRLTSYLRGQIPAGTIAPGSAAYCNDPVNPALSGMQQMKRWGFDGLGNWIYTRQQTGEIVTAEQRMANAFNEYTAINKAGTTVNPSYNANGELEYDGEYNYTWDAWGRLTMITDDNYWEDPVARFVYDADNRRVRRMDFYAHEEGTNWATQVYDYAYSGWRVLEEEKYRASYDNSSGYIDAFDYGLGFRQNIYGNYLDEVIAVQIDGDGDGLAHENVHDENSATGPDHRYYYCHNTLYSVIAITDEDADLVERYAYDPYGETYIYNAAGTKIADSLIDNVFTFTGQRFDPSLNANGYPRYLYYKNRYYLIPFGRFMSPDPIGWKGGINLYAYVKINPINFMDPFGFRGRRGEESRSNRRRGENGDIFDNRGRELFGIWMSGKGGHETRFEGEWGEYMRNNDILAPQLQAVILSDAYGRDKSGTINTGNFYASMQNGYYTGYEMLHQTIYFKIYGDVKVEECGDEKTVSYKVYFVWWDRIDPNPVDFPSDGPLADFLELVGNPEDYSIEIGWKDNPKVAFTKDENGGWEVNEKDGYPFGVGDSKEGKNRRRTDRRDGRR